MALVPDISAHLSQKLLFANSVIVHRHIVFGKLQLAWYGWECTADLQMMMQGKEFMG